LKTGAVILPLNPKKPKDQLKYYLADAGADILLTDSVNLELAREVFKKAGKPVISLDEMDFSQKCGNPVVLKDPNDPALLLYTSGSTGTPKGVLHAQKILFLRRREWASASNWVKKIFFGFLIIRLPSLFSIFLPIS